MACLASLGLGDPGGRLWGGSGGWAIFGVLASGLEAPPGFEPGIEDLQSSALPLGHGAVNGTGRPRGLREEPPLLLKRAGNRTRTGDPHLGKVVLYQLSYSRRGSGGRGRAISTRSLDPGS